MIDIVPFSGFVLGYMLCLATPGPNMMTLAAVSLRGWHYALPAALGIAAGAATLCVTSFALGTAATVNLPKIDEYGRIAAAGLMVFIGMMLLESDPFGRPSASTRRGHLALLAIGFATAVTNPISIAFFAAQFLGLLRNAGPVTLAAVLWSVPLLVLVHCCCVAVLMTRPTVRAAIIANAAAARLGIAGLFFLLAVSKLIPLQPTIPVATVRLDLRLVFELCGFAAGAMTLTAFFCRSMGKLRMAAICANVLFIVYAVGNDLFPILLLHAMLLPVNVARFLSLTRRRAVVITAGPSRTLLAQQLQWPAEDVWTRRPRIASFLSPTPNTV